MSIERNLLCLDIESSGLDVQNDRIIVLGIAKTKDGQPDSGSEHKFNPGIPIPEELTAIHGITDEMVKDAPKFIEWAHLIWAQVARADIDLVGYSCRQFDIQILQAEFQWAGIMDEWPLKGQRVFDAASVFQQKHPRDLNGACATYLRREASKAHSAMHDASDTLAVFLAQLQAHPELDAMTPQELHDYCARGAVDWAGKLNRNAKGQLCYAFGNSRGKTVAQDISFGYWMMGKDFPEQTKRILAAELDRLQNEGQQGLF